MNLDEKLAQVPGPARGLPLPGRQEPGHLHRQGGLPAEPRAVLLPGVARRATPRPTRWSRQIRDLEYIVTDNELEAMMLEANLVQQAPAPLQHHPARRQALPVPQAHHRTRSSRGWWWPGGCRTTARRYYGPFYPATAMRETLRLTRQLFPLRTCSITIDGPLRAPVHPVRDPSLQRAVHGLGDARGLRPDRARTWSASWRARDDDLARRLTQEMETAADEMKFERAAVLRDRVQALNKVRERQKIISTEEVDQDVVGVVRQGSEACVRALLRAQGPAASGGSRSSSSKVSGWSDGEILSAFVRQFYAQDGHAAAARSSCRRRCRRRS